MAGGINFEGRKDVRGLWTGANEGARFWLGVLIELRNRGVNDVYVVCVDGLKGFPQAIESVFPLAQVQLCIVHPVRNSLNYVTWHDRKKAAADLKPIYRATTAEQTTLELAELERKWSKYPACKALARSVGARHSILLDACRGSQGSVYDECGGIATQELRKFIEIRGSFPSEEAAIKLLYLAVTKTVAKWETVQHWKPFLNYLESCVAIEFVREARGGSRTRSKLTSGMVLIPPSRPLLHR